MALRVSQGRVHGESQLDVRSLSSSLNREREKQSHTRRYEKRRRHMRREIDMRRREEEEEKK